MQQPAQHLLSIELLPPPIFLDHHVRNFIDPFIRRKALVAPFTLTPSANRVRLFTLARINYSILGKSTVRTLHRNNSILAAHRPATVAALLSTSHKRSGAPFIAVS